MTVIFALEPYIDGLKSFEGVITCCSCVLFRFSMVQKHTVEFNQLAMANSEGSEAMLNRVMTKDNIGVAVLLELRREMMEMTRESL